MTGFRRTPIACDNMNHRRANAPVPHCPQCGGVVNPHAPRWNCTNDQHATARRQGTVFCIGCGTRLVVARR